MRSWVAASAGVVLVAMPMARAQQPAGRTPTFHSEIDYVEFPMRAVDGRGQFIHDLSQADVQIFEDGKPQTIETFRLIDVPAGSPGVALAVPRGYEITDARELAQSSGHIYVFVVDDYHLRPEELPRAKAVVGNFIRSRFTDNDRGAIVIASRGGQDFTGDRDLLLSALDRVGVPKEQAALPSERLMNAQSTLRVLSEASA